MEEQRFCHHLGNCFVALVEMLWSMTNIEIHTERWTERWTNKTLFIQLKKDWILLITWAGNWFGSSLWKEAYRTVDMGNSSVAECDSLSPILCSMGPHCRSVGLCWPRLSCSWWLHGDCLCLGEFLGSWSTASLLWAGVCSVLIIETFQREARRSS